MSTSSTRHRISYLSQTQAQQLDVDLMGEGYAFKVEQLMELAGLSCAQAVHKLYPPETHKKVLVACGPGNQGGDGLVLARHLWHFGYSPRVFLPKETDKELYKALKTQCLKLSIPHVAAEATDDEAKGDAFEKEVASTDVIVDAIFGFSFKGSPRPPFARPLAVLTSLTSPVPSASLPTSAHPHPPHTTKPTSPSSSFQPSGAKRPKVISVDIPSSWNVETGPPSRDEQGEEKAYFEPDALVSLTAPKLGSKWFKGRHLLGGRFVPPGIVEKYGLKLPPYPGADQVVDITGCEIEEKL